MKAKAPSPDWRVENHNTKAGGVVAQSGDLGSRPKLSYLVW